MDGALRSALDAAAPDREVRDVAATGPSWNDDNETVRVTFADDDDPSALFCKVALDGDGSRIARERAALAAVSAADRVPVPRVVAADPTASVPYLLTAPVEGETLLDRGADADAATRRDLARAVGRSLADLHDLYADSLDFHGEIRGVVRDGDGRVSGVDVRGDPWTDVLLARIEWIRTASPSDRFDDHFRRVAEVVAANRDRLDDAVAALCHFDLAKPNCFVLDGDGDGGDGGDDPPTAGLLDWERACVGDPVRDLVRGLEQGFEPMRGDDEQRLGDAFLDGYREQVGGLPAGYEEREPIYRAVRHLGVSGYFENYVRFVDEDSAAFAEWTEAELDRRLARV
ncbi:phosphotransferase family protein [Halobaculum marinum]|uniref:Phosphotransferase family protein n=1 Tax=Halobaculum marinum TaxID=3031996 RepID=A0ABD5X5F0_9EURY|nr:phosphotransferase [Halobaculum sp. DT55]